jgi:excisionase family DNA binding protein
MNNWPTQTEAAVQLGTNERTIRRWIESGRLKSSTRPVVGRKPATIVDPEDVERLREERHPVVLVEKAEKSLQRMAADPAIPDTQVMAAFKAAIRETPKEPKPWLTLKEAAEYSGLPAAWLLKNARMSGLGIDNGVVVAMDVGSGKRAVWRFSRNALSR